MSSSTRWEYFHAAFPVHLSPLLLLILAAGFLAVAAPASAQLTATPANVIFNAPGTTIFTISVPAGTTVASVAVLTLGAPNLDFTEVPSGTTCPAVTSGTCTVEVQFQPLEAGRRQGSVVLTDPNGNTLINISLDGAGSQPMAGFSPSAISTFAGGGKGAAGSATSALLGMPTGITIDGFGNYYIVDQKGNEVYKVTPAGAISTFAGTGAAGYSGDGGPAVNATLNGPTDVVVDGAGFVYISDTNNNVVRKVTTSGIISTYAGQYYAPGTTPPPVCAAATNSVGDGCPGNQITLNTPIGLVFCHAQNLHIADKLDNRVRTVDHVKYTTTTQVGDGTAGYNGDGEGNTSAELNGPTGMDMDAANFIYVADSGNHIIRKTLLTGTTPNPISTVAGTPSVSGNAGDGGPAVNAQLNDPRGVRVDPAGDIFITDYASNVVREVSAATGAISTIAGTGTAGLSGDGGPATGAEVNAPFEIVIDKEGNLYFADSQNGVVRKIDMFDGPSVTFPATPAGVKSSAQDVSVMNLGSAPLAISQINTPANFSLGGADSSCTTSSETLNAGQDCILGIEFTPQSAGTATGTITLTDNSNPATQTIALTGAGTGSSSAATYTVTAETPTISMAAGSTGTDTLTVSSTNYAGTVSFTTSVTSSDGTAANVTASATPVTLASGATGTSTLTITTNADAANRAPGTPWESGGTAMFCTFLIGLPFISRKRRLTALMVLTIPIALAGSLIACGGTNTTRPRTTTARTYVVTATPTASVQGSATVTNPSPITITVTIQ